MKKKKICILWHCAYPWDIRIEKFCRTFVSSNYSVSIICRGNYKSLRTEKKFGVDIYRVLPPGWWPKPVFTAPLFINPIWIINVRKLLLKIKPDVLIVRDIPMALLAGLLAKKIGIPIVLDMAENYPAALLVFKKKLSNPWLFANGLLPRLYEKICARLMSHILVVAEEQKSRLVNIGVEPDKISIVMNTPDLQYFDVLERNNQGDIQKDNHGNRLIYVGFLEAHRCVDVLIKSVSQVARVISPLSLMIVGSGSILNRLQKLAQDLNAAQFITFCNWVPFEKIPMYIRSSDIGIIPHLKSEHTDTTIPNKLFDYMAFGKPVITSNLNPVSKIVNETGCGSIFESKNAEDLADKIVEMIKKGNSEKIGLNGLNAVKERYNWGIDREILLTSISNILKVPKELNQEPAIYERKSYESR